MSSSLTSLPNLDEHTAELLDALLDTASTANVLLDAHARVIRVNTAFVRLYHNASGLLGRPLSEGLPGVGLELQQHAQQALSSGLPVSHHLTVPISSASSWPNAWRTHFTPVRDRGGNVTGVVLSTNVSPDEDRERPETAKRFRVMNGASLNAPTTTKDASRLQRLYMIALALAKAHTLTEVVSVVLNQVLREMGAYAGSVILLEPDQVHLRMVGSVGYPGLVTDNFAVFPLTISAPACDAVIHRQMINITQAEMRVRYVDTAQTPFPDYHSHVLLPLYVEDKPIGTLTLTFDSPKRFIDEDVEFLESVAEGCAHALERGRVLETEQRARAELEQVTAVLNAVLEHGQAGFALFDTKLRFIRANKAFAKFAGRNAEELLGMKLLDVVPKLAPIARALAATRDSGKATLHQPVQITGNSNDGESWLASYYPVNTSSGVLVGLGCTVIQVRP